jgi:hypothetical protein
MFPVPDPATICHPTRLTLLQCLSKQTCHAKEAQLPLDSYNRYPITNKGSNNNTRHNRNTNDYTNNSFSNRSSLRSLALAPRPR